MRLIADIRRRGCIKDTDVATLARSFQINGGLSEFDVDLLFDLHARCAIKDPAWSTFFETTVSDYIVRDVDPQGYLTLAQAQWLQSRLSNDADIIATKVELDLLRGIIERARWVPGSLVQFALGQILNAVDTGRGALRCGQIFEAGRITPAEVAWVREVLVAYGSESGLRLTLPEVEGLLAINDALDGEEQDADWTDLMARVHVDAVMTACGYASLERRSVLRAGPRIAIEDVDPTAPAPGILPASVAELMRAYQPVSREDLIMERLECQRVEIITGEDVRLPDAAWLSARLAREAPLSVVERTVLGAFAVAGPILPVPLGDIARPGHRAA